MNAADKNFRFQFVNFVGLANDFCDPDDDSKSDEEIARLIRTEVPPRQRLVLINELINDVDRILESIDTHWNPLQRYLNRKFKDAGEARTWLLEIRGVWQDELARLKKS